MELHETRQFNVLAVRDDPGAAGSTSDVKLDVGSIHTVKLVDYDLQTSSKQTQALPTPPARSSSASESPEPYSSSYPSPTSTPPSEPLPPASVPSTPSSKPDPKAVKQPIVPISNRIFRESSEKPIHFVLVVRNKTTDAADEMKNTFISKALRSGLEIEVEQGQNSSKKHLSFIKIHAPEDVVQRYGKLFCQRRYFKSSHAELIKPHSAIEKLLPFTRIKDEKRHVEYVRRMSHPLYSNHEISLIVYKILLNLPFGKPKNFVGLTRLKQYNVVLAAYALHDGPQTVTRQTKDLNARQLLNRTWTGCCNFWKVMPVHQIQDYFGDKIAFYFAFYDFYNQALALLSFVATVCLFLQTFFIGDDIVLKEVCGYNKALFNKKEDFAADSNHVYICPDCIDYSLCPYRPARSFCRETAFLNIIDNPNNLKYCTFVAFWSILFIWFWRRRERLYCWIWESKSVDPKLLMKRSLFVSRIKRNPRHGTTGVLANLESDRIALLRMIITTCITASIMLLSPLYGKKLNSFCKGYMLKEYQKYFIGPLQAYQRLSIVFMLGLVHAFLLILMEPVAKLLSYILTNFENHRTRDTYDLFFSTRRFCLIFCYTFSVIVCMGWVKPFYHDRHFSGKDTPFNKHLFYYYEVCGMFSCLDEMCMLMIALLLVKVIAVEIVSMIFTWVTHPRIRDYSETSPAWEQEYKLRHMSSGHIADRYHRLAMQFTIASLFSVACPIAPLIIFLINVIRIRLEADALLLHTRRPVMLDAASIAPWRRIFLFIGIAACFTNALTMVFTTRTVTRMAYQYETGTMKNFYKYHLTPTVLCDNIEKCKMKKDGSHLVPKVNPSSKYIVCYMANYRMRFYVPTQHWVTIMVSGTGMRYGTYAIMFLTFFQLLIFGTTKYIDNVFTPAHRDELRMASHMERLTVRKRQTEQWRDPV